MDTKLRISLGIVRATVSDMETENESLSIIKSKTVVKILILVSIGKKGETCSSTISKSGHVLPPMSLFAPLKIRERLISKEAFDKEETHHQLPCISKEDIIISFNDSRYQIIVKR